MGCVDGAVAGPVDANVAVGRIRSRGNRAMDGIAGAAGAVVGAVVATVRAGALGPRPAVHPAATTKTGTIRKMTRVLLRIKTRPRVGRRRL